MDNTIDDVRKIVQDVKNVFQTEHEVKKITFGTMMQKIKAVNTFLAEWEEYKLAHPDDVYRQLDIAQVQYNQVVKQNRKLQQELNQLRRRTNVTTL